MNGLGGLALSWTRHLARLLEGRFGCGVRAASVRTRNREKGVLLCKIFSRMDTFETIHARSTMVNPMLLGKSR
jgi:hypothetical protein